MDYNRAQKNSEENLKKLINESWENENFKKEFMENPERTMEGFFNTHIDFKDKKVVVSDQTDLSKVYINIPANPNNMELTEAELEAVAGGKGIEILWTGLCLTY